MSLKSVAENGLVEHSAHTSRVRWWSSCCRSIRRRRYRLGVGMLPLARAVLENSDFPSLVRKARCFVGRYGVTAIGVELRTSTT